MLLLLCIIYVGLLCSVVSVMVFGLVCMVVGSIDSFCRLWVLLSIGNVVSCLLGVSFG